MGRWHTHLPHTDATTRSENNFLKRQGEKVDAAQRRDKMKVNLLENMYRVMEACLPYM